MAVSNTSFQRFIFAAVLGSILAGCESNAPPSNAEVPIPYADPEPDSKSASSDDSPPAADVVRTGPFDLSLAGITFSAPKGWQEVKLASGQTGFVDARLVIPAKSGQVELTCLVSGGGIEANFSRWTGQFITEPGGRATEPIDVDGADGQWIELRGTFNGSSSGKPGPHENWAMLGVGIPLKSKECFLKLNGPKEAVAEIRDQFRDFVKSARLAP